MRSAQERMNEELMREERRAGRNMGLFVVFCVVFTLTTATVTIVYPLITGFSN